eukprot:m.374403 g.374403  ORF g.374403 m.374403 type:complete len:61 (+) comp56164_c0_seq1:179-361(+)
MRGTGILCGVVVISPAWHSPGSLSAFNNPAASHGSSACWFGKPSAASACQESCSRCFASW